MKVAVKICLCFIACVLAGCNAKNRVLADGISRVPVDENAFKNRKYFDASLLKVIDTNALYSEENPDTDRFNTYYRFYSNGNVSLFHIKGGGSIKAGYLDPANAGTRGVYYSKNGKIHMDLFTTVGYGFSAVYDVTTDILVVEENKLMRYDDKDDIYPDIYIKGNIPPGAEHFTADW